MAKVMKSFRLSESAIAALENRDTQKYRSGQEYIEALLLNHEEKSEPTIETVLEELKKLNEKIEKFFLNNCKKSQKVTKKKKYRRCMEDFPIHRRRLILFSVEHP